jgi:tetratricopeptide (TPR) repeat protein
MTTKNLLLSIAGLALGFAAGFLIANRITTSQQAAPAAEARAADGDAGPLDPSQSQGSLPPGHPDIGSLNSDGSPAGPEGAAASSADAQSAMEAADAKPQDFESQMKAAAVFYRLAAYEKAALYLERAIKLRPKDADALLEMGNTKYDAGDFKSAADYYGRSLAVRPDDADVRTDLGNTYFRRDPPDYRRAAEEYRRALQTDPRHQNALKNLASAALNLKDKAAAREAVEKLAEVNPNHPELASLRGALEALP